MLMICDPSSASQIKKLIVYLQNLPSFVCALCYTVLHMCGHTILHNYSVIIFCDGETSEIFLTTRALIYADLMGDYCDFWKVFTWRSGAQCDWTTD